MSVIRVFCIFPADTETRTPGQKARKFTVSEKKIPLKDWIEVGVFGPAQKGEQRGKPLYLRKHLFENLVELKD